MKTVTLKDKVYAPSKVMCVGRNFPDHIAEMGESERPAHPTIFIKPNSAIAFGTSEVTIPKEFGMLHHEVELCFIADGEGGIAGYAVGLDLTLRDLQSAAKKAGMPWALAKGFDNAALLGKFVSAESIADPEALDMVLAVNGIVRQQSNTSKMIFSPRELLAYVSRYMTIEEGDVFMCGTPGGVGAIDDGDRLEANIMGLPLLDVVVHRR